MVNSKWDRRLGCLQELGPGVEMRHGDMANVAMSQGNVVERAENTRAGNAM